MSDNVHQLFAHNQLAPTNELKAQYLEGLAARLRDGSCPELSKCVFVGAPASGEGVIVEPFGGPASAMEIVGLLEFAKLQFIV